VVGTPASYSSLSVTDQFPYPYNAIELWVYVYLFSLEFYGIKIYPRKLSKLYFTAYLNDLCYVVVKFGQWLKNSLLRRS
jgi:hypothetical protein